MLPKFVALTTLLGLASPIAAQSIRDSATVQSDGAALFLDLRGADSTRPVVLFLHGGPANVRGLLTFMAYTGVELEQSFLMVYLHQRGVGKSGPAPVESQSVAQHVRDVDQVVKYLRRRFPASAISLMGHSWGGTLATSYVLEHGAKLSRLVQIAGLLSVPRGDSVGYQLALRNARARQHAEAVRALEEIGPPPWQSLDQVMVERRWAFELSGAPRSEIDFGRVLRAGGYQQPDPRWEETEMAIIRRIAPEMLPLDLEPRLAAARTSLLLIACGKDPVVPPASLRPGFDRYGGPKQWVLFEGSGHAPYLDATERFVTVVTAFLQGRAP